MDARGSLGGQRPRPPQRAVSGGPYGFTQPVPKRPNLPSGLSNVRSVSQPTNVVDLTAEASGFTGGNATNFVGSKETVVGSPDGFEVEESSGERPAKRIKTVGSPFRGDEDLDLQARDGAYRNNPGTPLPSLPMPKRTASSVGGQRGNHFSIEPSSRKAHGIEPPAIATRVPPPKKAADFSPWTGSHPEDVLNENVIKTGFSDKLQSTHQAESNSAKATISSSLSQKNNPGLSLLGYLFTAVLEKRQTIGKCTQHSAFKPPPRVTVTDTKREAWLRDLANPDVPLRKQSRTIPHGIRGKLLMDQCLSKDIPLQRAVWLAKCVGANELRAFRRKGVSGSAAASGEAKWVAEWTVHVEQFLEDAIATCGQTGWKQKINYAVKLATSFYAEKLLDAGHYLDWIVASMAGASASTVPIWIVLVQLYWKELTSYASRGRKLTEGILEHLHLLTKSSLDVHTALKTRLQKLVTLLAISNRGCLVIPRTWQKYKYLFTLDNDPATTARASNIVERNERLAAPMTKTAESIRSPLLDLYAELDAIRLELDVEDLTAKCISHVPDIARLVPALIEWASTQYRTGMSRVYLAARVVAHIRYANYDTDGAILIYLATANSLSDYHIDLVHRVIVELVRLQAFSVSRYLQWLITSGGLTARALPICAVQLITALDPADLPHHARNTRNTLMKRLGSLKEESVMTEKFLEGLDGSIDEPGAGFLDSTLLPEALSLSARFSISSHICARVRSLAKDVGMRLEHFLTTRHLMESVGDVHSLLQLTTEAVATTNTELLATVIDTANYHAESFTALGGFKILLEALKEHYLAIRSSQPLDRTTIVAFAMLMRRMPEQAASVTLLDNDLAICDQQHSIAVCSPASDSLIGMHASSLDSDDDIDAVFASGNTMDEQLMQRVLMRIVQRAEKPVSANSHSSSRICDWLNQLRAVDGGVAFDEVAAKYVRKMLSSPEENTNPNRPIAYIVASGCLTLGVVAGLVVDAAKPRTANTVLPLFMRKQVAPEGLTDAVRYRFHLQQRRCQCNHIEALSTIVRLACEVPEFDAADPELVSFIVRANLLDPSDGQSFFVSDEESRNSYPGIHRIMSVVLMGYHSPALQDTYIDTKTVLAQASPLSIKFSAGILKHLRDDIATTNEYQTSTVQAILEAFNTGSDVWPQLLETLGPRVNEAVRVWAQDQLLLYRGIDKSRDKAATGTTLARLLDLFAVSSRFTDSNRCSNLVVTVTNRLKDLGKRLPDSADDGESGRSFMTLVRQLWTVLHLCTFYASTTSEDDEKTILENTNLLAELYALLVHPRLQVLQDLVEYLSDLSSIISDSVPDVSRSLLQQQLSGRLSLDARLMFILGTGSPGLDNWLQLASQVPPTESQQQRALNKHVSQTNTAHSRSASTGQLLQHTHPQHQRNPSYGGQGPCRHDGRPPIETKTIPYPLRSWEIMQEVMGDNNTSLDLRLFGARRV